jgi:hypothetical protein
VAGPGKDGAAEEALGDGIAATAESGDLHGHGGSGVIGLGTGTIGGALPESGGGSAERVRPRGTGSEMAFNGLLQRDAERLVDPTVAHDAGEPLEGGAGAVEGDGEGGHGE